MPHNEKVTLDDLEARAVRLIHSCYGPTFDDSARFWIQKGIEGMRFAVAESVLDGTTISHGDRELSA